MAANKTVQSNASVEAYLAGISDESRRQDCRDLIKLMSKVSKEPPKMWGTSIVGFGSYHYTYESGREGDSCLVGFSSRKGDISVYLSAGMEGRTELLAQLGKHKSAKACVYIRALADVDPKVLERLVAGTITERKRLYP